MNQLTVIKSIRFSAKQAESLAILESYGVNINRFIRIAIKEKLAKDDRIKEIQDKTAFPDSVSVCQALLQVWNECQQDNSNNKYTEDDMRKCWNTLMSATALNKPVFFDDYINSLNKQD